MVFFFLNSSVVDLGLSKSTYKASLEVCWEALVVFLRVFLCVVLVILVWYRILIVFYAGIGTNFFRLVFEGGWYCDLECPGLGLSWET